MILIGFNGKIGCGKSTAADYLEDYYRQNFLCTVHRLAFASALKNIAINYFGLSYDDCYTQNGKASFNPFWGMTNREILQRIGTEAFRNGFHKDTWTKILELQIIDIEKTEQKRPNVIIIDDVRFPNEAEMISTHDGKIFSIIRPNNTIDNAGILEHDSEQDLPTNLITLGIVNSGTISELCHKVKAAVSTCKLTDISRYQ